MSRSEIIDRVLLGGYEAAKKDATRKIVARYARGNVAVQNGYYIDEDELQALRLAGDKAMQNIRDWHPKIRADDTDIHELIEYRQTKSNAVSRAWKDKAYEDLKAFSADVKKDDTACNAESVGRAEQFIHNLPLNIDRPTVSIEDQGNILIEWYKRPPKGDATIFSVVFDTESYVYSLLKNGVPDTHGALNYTAGSLEMILTLLNKDFGIISDARLKP